MKRHGVWWLAVSIILGWINLSHGSELEDILFSSANITIRLSGNGLGLEIRLPDGRIEKVTPPPGIPVLYPPRVPESEEAYKAAIAELESLVSVYPTMKLSLCELYRKVGKNLEARDCYEGTADLFRSRYDMATQVFALNQSAILQWELDQKEAAIQQAQASFDVYRQQVRGLRQAEKHYQDALHTARDAGDLEQQLLAHHQLALVSYALGNVEQSREHAERVLTLFAKIDTPLMGKQRLDKLIVQQIRELLEELQMMTKEAE